MSGQIYNLTIWVATRIPFAPWFYAWAGGIFLLVKIMNSCPCNLYILFFNAAKGGGMEETMLDLKFVRENPEIVKQNIKNKFQDKKLTLIDEVIALDVESRNTKAEADNLRADRNKISKQIGGLMAQGKKEEAEELKKQVTADSERLAVLEENEVILEEKIKKIMMTIPNIIDPSVPIGKDDSENVEVKRYGEPIVPDFDVPYHTEIMEKFNGIDLDSARKVAGNGFYYLMGNIARLHSAVISYARDFMIERGFTYCIPPYMIRSEVVTGVMSFAEMDAMMYKIEGEDLYLIGTSEHSMIGKYIDTILPEETLPQALTSYSPCFRKEKGAHGLEERGVYRIHQFEKQEMIVVCKPEDSMKWFDVLWQNTVDLFRTLDIPVRTLECCSGDLADLKVKSIDVEAWSPRQKKYFEVGSCSNLGDAQARRLKIRVVGEEGKYFAHTLNNTVVAPPRMLIAFLENNLNADGSVNVPVALQPYMGGLKVIQ
ncbi:MAG: seryl-tRNA synthetase [Herbinix sp.]|jgi:seryl-tRNA synthetase|nr:seryl-tRNA synthetase [Herbinix sp.]